jgi:hypothetical protein
MIGLDPDRTNGWDVRRPAGAAPNPDGVLSPHSVLTENLIDEPGQPTHAALHWVLDFLRTRLQVS